MELFTGGVSGLAGILVALELRKHARHPCLPAIVPYVVVLAFGGLRNLEFGRQPKSWWCFSPSWFSF